MLLSICAAIFLGAQASSIPFLLGKDRAKAAVAALVATEQGVNLIAPPLGGAIFGLVGALLAGAGDQCRDLPHPRRLSIASVASFGPEEPGAFPPLAVIGRDIAAGFRFVFADPTMRMLTFSSTAINAVAIFGFVAMIPFSQAPVRGRPIKPSGSLFGCFSLGSVAGSLIAGRTHWPFGRALAIVYVLDALFWLPIIWTPYLAVAVGMVSLCAGCGAYEITSIVAWRMRIIPADMVGRVFGVIRLLVLVGMVPASILGGRSSPIVGGRAWSWACPVGSFLLLALNLLSSPHGTFGAALNRVF